MKEAPAKYAEKLVQLFLGMKPTHTPHHKSWSRLPYDEKDKHAFDLETGVLEQMGLDDEESPIVAVLRQCQSTTSPRSCPLCSLLEVQQATLSPSWLLKPW
jgi:hypothetical protein